MKRVILFNIILVFICLFQNVNAQTGKVTIDQVNDGVNIDVSIYLKRTSETPWSLGFASFVVNYNNVAMDSASELAEGPWDNNSNPDYADQFIATYGGGTAKSIEIGLNALPSDGTAVSEDSTLVGTIRFKILDPTVGHNLRWRLPFCAVLDNQGNDMTGQILFSDPSNGLLPVELSNFVASTNAREVILNWNTSKEINNAGFSIERSLLNKNSKTHSWQSAGFVPGNGNTNENKSYEFIDRNLQSGTYNYRLKQTDFNGNYEYFNLNNEITVGIPVSFDLSQNYPNPFNPNTIINYQLPVAGNVKMKIYDMSGKEMLTLVNTMQEAGYYSIDFNASNLSSGVYFYKIEAGNFVAAKKMVILK